MGSAIANYRLVCILIRPLYFGPARWQSVLSGRTTKHAWKNRREHLLLVANYLNDYSWTLTPSAIRLPRTN